MRAMMKRDAANTNSIWGVLTGMAGALALLTATPAFAWTQAEIDAAIATLDTPEARLCPESNGSKLELPYEIKDINGDAIDELIVHQQASGAASCFGHAGSEISLLISDGNGGWADAFGFPGSDLAFHPRTDSDWPDVEILGPGFCFPVWRYHEGSYGIWRTCEDGKLVYAEGLRDNAVPSGVASGGAKAKPADHSGGNGIGTLSPVEVIDVASLDGIPYDHNGSIMIVDGAKGVIVYDHPKNSIAGTVKRGTVLFRGKPWDMNNPDGVLIDGVAHTFKKGCDATEYPVRGRYHVMYGMSQFTLEGAAPIRSKTNCDITGHSMTSGNAKLKFDIAWD